MRFLTSEQKSIFRMDFFLTLSLKDEIFGVTTYSMPANRDGLSRNSICWLRELVFPRQQMELKICDLI